MSNARDKANIPALNFSSTGIDDNATSTAITINSSEVVSIGTTVATATLNVLADSGSEGIDVLGRSSDNRSRIQLRSNDGSTGYSQWDYNGTTVELKATANVPLVFRTNNTERMRIDSSGNVGIGNTVASTINSANGTGNLVVGSGTGTEGITIYSGTTGEGTLQFADASTGAGTYVGQVNYNHSNNFMSFGVNGSERMRIDSSGGLGVGDTPFTETRLTLKAPSSGNQYMVYGKNGAGANTLIIAGNGNITNFYGSYGTISDENLKQNIVNANSQWNDIKSLEIKNYKLRSDVELNPETAPNLLGVIAQDLESSNMSGLVSVQNEVLWSENDELPEGVNVGDVKQPSHKSVKYSVLYMKAVKALQEAMERIETLEAKVQTLENNQP